MNSEKSKSGDLKKMAENYKMKILTVLLAAGVVAVAGIFAYALLPGLMEEGNSPDYIIKVTSEEELKVFLDKYQKSYDQSPADYLLGGFIGNQKTSADGVMYEKSVMREQGITPPIPAPTSAPTSGTGSASDYSETNVQVKGVDEADFVKNDGKYIYILSGDKLVIADSYPPEKASIVYEGEIDGYQADSVFLNGDTLVVFTQDSSQNWITPKESSAPVPVSRQITRALVYDVSDRKNPEVVRNIELPGTYENVRMIGDYIYAVSRMSVSRYDEIVMPVVKVNGEIVTDSAIWCPPVYDYNFVTHTVTSFNIKKDDKPKSESFLTGWDNTLYVSPDNIYMAYEYYMPQSRTDIYTANEAGFSSGENQQSTVIHRFSIDKGDIKYRATGVVPGSLLNQWSLDEFDNHLRVATTLRDYSGRESEMYNNVYVMDSDLKITGRLEHIAPDERIYSARFMGDLLYLVTFKQMDPFFVIDLSDPKQPGILGELKIPGYSDYLHPYDENHIIGIGKSTFENEWGGVTAGGLKIALFDVKDLNNPKLVDDVIIGTSGTDSEVLRDHRAFLFDKEKNILVIPVFEITKVPVEDSRYEDSYSRGSWNGVYVFGISPDSGFSLKGKVEQTETDNSRYWYGGDSVKRSIFMDNYLYTISNDKIAMSDLNNPGEKINEIELPFEDYYYPYY